jgi:D-alanyl-D-alanine carboxypeptidase
MRRIGWVAAGLVAILGLTGGVAGASTKPPQSPQSHQAPQPPAPAGLTDAMGAMVAAGFPGVVVYARRDGRRWKLAAGVADRATGEPARPDDRFRIFSNTKSFASTVLLQLVAERRLRLDDPVDRWLPGRVRGNGNDGTRITVRQLLNNTSGVYDPTNDPGFATDRGGQTPDEVVDAALAHPPLFAPGAGWDYSNTNYILAGMVIQSVTRHSPATEIRRRILVPLGLHDTSFPLSDPAIPGRHLHGYDLDQRDVTRFNPSGEWTAGAMISTGADLARFDRALFGGALLPPAQQRDLETTVANGYGLGVQRVPVPCPDGPVSAWETDGGGSGYTSMALTTTDGDRQFVLAGNVFDLARDQRHEPPVPDARDAVAGAMTAVLCTGGAGS